MAMAVNDSFRSGLEFMTRTRSPACKSIRGRSSDWRRLEQTSIKRKGHPFRRKRKSLRGVYEYRVLSTCPTNEMGHLSSQHLTGTKSGTHTSKSFSSFLYKPHKGRRQCTQSTLPRD